METKAKITALAAVTLFLSTFVVCAQALAPFSSPVSSREPNVTVMPEQMPATAPATLLSVAAKRQIETAVGDQLAAIARGDARQAFNNLSPATQAYFVQPEAFLSAIAQEAAPIVRTRSFSFVGMQAQHGGVLQQVLLTDDRGRDWLAKFEVQQQPDGGWKVKGCVVAAVTGLRA